MLRIYTDFNHGDERGHYLLDTTGSLRDIKRLEPQLQDGLEVLLYDEELEVPATLKFDQGWMGILKDGAVFSPINK